MYYLFNSIVGIGALVICFFDYIDIASQKSKTVYGRSNTLFVFFILHLVVAFGAWIYYGRKQDILMEFVTVFGGVILCFAIYNVLLLLLIHSFRKRLTATACAYLWTIPNYLYIMFFGGVYQNRVPAPWGIIYIPRQFFVYFLWIWLVGFLLLLCRAFLQNHRFRKSLLENAYLEENDDILFHFRGLKYRFDPENKIQLLRSPVISTPVSIGIELNKMKVILPVKEYSLEEYDWIFRHELTHLRKNDCSLKMFLAITNAVFWFIPFSWMATKMMAEDQELSCDEAVLYREDSDKRLEYANLILNTAGESKGFSTCLSSTGQSMRYRLKHIVHPETHEGTHNIITLCVISFLLVFVACSIEISVNGGRADQLILQDKTCFDHIETIYLYGKDDDTPQLIEIQPEMIRDYISDLKVVEARSAYIDYDEDYVEIRFDDEWITSDQNPGMIEFTIDRHYLCVLDKNYDRHIYRIYDDILEKML